MARKTVVFKLTCDVEDKPEGVQVHASGDWQSPPGGWLVWQAGEWEEVPHFLNLLGPSAKKIAAQLRSVNFQTVSKGKKGEALYPEKGTNGHWEAIDVVDLP